MNYGTNGIISEYSGMLSGLNSFNNASITSSNPPKKVFFGSRNGGLAYMVEYSSHIDRLLVIQYAWSVQTDIYVVNPNNNTIENVLTSPTNELGGVGIVCVGDKAYISYHNTSFFKVLDLNTLTFTSDRIATGGTNAYVITYSALTDKLYIPNYGSNNLTVFDRATLTLSTTIDSVNGAVWALPIDSLNRLYISAHSSSQLQIYDLTTLSLITTITGIPQAYQLAYCSSNNCLYISAYSGASVHVVNCSTNTIVTTISIPNSTPLDVKYNPNNGLIYVSLSNSTFKGIAIINPSTNTILEYYREVTQPYHFVFCPSNNKMYFTQYNGNNLVQL
jgi:DNA-binding beta-propeller fold protein YncE